MNFHDLRIFYETDAVRERLHAPRRPAALRMRWDLQGQDGHDGEDKCDAIDHIDALNAIERDEEPRYSGADDDRRVARERVQAHRIQKMTLRHEVRDDRMSHRAKEGHAGKIEPEENEDKRRGHDTRGGRERERKRDHGEEELRGSEELFAVYVIGRESPHHGEE